MNWTRVDVIARELAATRAEVLGLAMLLAGGILVTWLVVQRPVAQDLTATPLTTLAGASASPGPLHPTPTVPTRAAQLLVHVTGAVASPGVVRLDHGARVVDAIEAAGGATGRAMPEALNLARAVVDGEQVRVPTVHEVVDGDGTNGPAAGPALASPGPVATGDARLDLTTATAPELEALPGIGPVLAQRIVEWREANGGFVDVGQLREVSGIGEATFQDIAPLARVG